ncbi:molybdenum ABC transporter ATP-binding protein ModC [Vibrio sp. S17_S38]|uniref:molybdenum ABC transporter ATP-binding protein ModC n=1 Tax=Vibrio sp. S17_S38 TaxID=2720229 RepID=UPI0016817E63|nr:molybdenum ABC transporter ATP-binding protein ModC [Vibrio sp. S17_S38]MBD1572518.1 molybdenum ABC transporter ATP-binding protein ModC [Vibrio sp. S17_S38]
MISLRFYQKLDQFELNIDADIPATGITAIFGRSGAGKTSVINAISGLKNPTSGRITKGDHVLFDSKLGINQPIEKRKIGYVFQEARLFPHYKVKGNLLYGVKGKVDAKKLEQVVKLLDLSNLLSRYPADLSGGEKQRCAIARALLSEPEILLMDEPLASLDLPRKQEVMPFLERLSSEVNIPILYVTHSMDEILHLADHMLLIEDGRVKEAGDIETLWRSPALTAWHHNNELSTLFKGKVKQKHDRYDVTYVEFGPQVGVWMSGINAQQEEILRIRIHASDVSITLEHASDTSIRNILPATIVKLADVTDPTAPVSVLLRLGNECEKNHDQSLSSCLWANITAWAYDDLNLHEGQTVYAQIKGVSLTNRDMARKG